MVKLKENCRINKQTKYFVYVINELVNVFKHIWIFSRISLHFLIYRFRKKFRAITVELLNIKFWTTKNWIFDSGCMCHAFLENKPHANFTITYAYKPLNLTSPSKQSQSRTPPSQVKRSRSPSSRSQRSRSPSFHSICSLSQLSRSKRSRSLLSHSKRSGSPSSRTRRFLSPSSRTRRSRSPFKKRMSFYVKHGHVSL